MTRNLKKLVDRVFSRNEGKVVSLEDSIARYVHFCLKNNCKRKDVEILTAVSGNIYIIMAEQKRTDDKPGMCNFIVKFKISPIAIIHNCSFEAGPLAPEINFGLNQLDDYIDKAIKLLGGY